jgi:hypothetical protein
LRPTVKVSALRAVAYRAEAAQVWLFESREPGEQSAVLAALPPMKRTPADTWVTTGAACEHGV